MIYVSNIALQRMLTIFKRPRAKYAITVNMEATVYIGIKLTWDYVHRTVALSMPSYVKKALHRFQHIVRGGKE